MSSTRFNNVSLRYLKATGGVEASSWAGGFFWQEICSQLVT